MKPIISILVVLRIIALWKVFNYPWVMAKGGPGTATTLVSVYAYITAFQKFDLGSGAATGLILMIIVLVLTLVYIRLITRGGQAS